MFRRLLIVAALLGCAASASGQQGAPVSVVTYCTAKINSNSCPPMITYAGPPGEPSVTGASLNVVALFIVRNLSPRPVAGAHLGAFFYSTFGAQGTPFQGGTLCVLQPIKQIAPLQNTGGTVGSTVLCDSLISTDFNARIQSGIDPALVAGATVWMQGQARDTQLLQGIQLSDACTFVIAP